MSIDWTTNAGPQRALPARARNAAGGSLPTQTAGPSLSSAPAPANDDLVSERNAAVAEARLWLRRVQLVQQERDQARADLRACDKSHSEWEAAYTEVMQMLRRTEAALNHERFAHAAAEDMLRHYRTLLRLMAEGRVDEIDPELYR